MENPTTVYNPKGNLLANKTLNIPQEDWIVAEKSAKEKILELQEKHEEVFAFKLDRKDPKLSLSHSAIVVPLYDDEKKLKVNEKGEIEFDIFFLAIDKIEGRKGDGSIGKVLCCVNKKREYYVVKKFKTYEKEQLEVADKESNNLNYINCLKAYVKIKKPGEKKYKVYIIQTEFEGVELFYYLHDKKNSNIFCNPIEKCKIALEVIKEIQKLHNNRILHCDLKSENMILDYANDLPKIHIIDFDQAEIFKKELPLFKERLFVGGTPGFIAPEKFLGFVSSASDVYAAGILLRFDLELDWIPNNDTLKNLIDNMLKENLNERPKLKNIITILEEAIKNLHDCNDSYKNSYGKYYQYSELYFNYKTHLEDEFNQKAKAEEDGYYNRHRFFSGNIKHNILHFKIEKDIKNTKNKIIKNSEELYNSNSYAVLIDLLKDLYAKYTVYINTLKSNRRSDKYSNDFGFMDNNISLIIKKTTKDLLNKDITGAFKDCCINMLIDNIKEEHRYSDSSIALLLIDILKENGINFNDFSKYDENILVLAAKNNKTGVVKELIKIKGVDINAQDRKLGCTALIYAVQNNNLETIEELLKIESIDINVQDKLAGWTALVYAVDNFINYAKKPKDSITTNNCGKVIKILLEHEADSTVITNNDEIYSNINDREVIELFEGTYQQKTHFKFG